MDLHLPKKKKKKNGEMDAIWRLNCKLYNIFHVSNLTDKQ